MLAAGRKVLVAGLLTAGLAVGLGSATVPPAGVRPGHQEQLAVLVRPERLRAAGDQELRNGTWLARRSARVRHMTPRLTDPVTKEIALELVSTAENSTTSWRSSYSYIEDIGDGRGYTGGIVGWCSGTGDMLALVRRYAVAAPGNPLQKYVPQLQQVMAAPYVSRPSLSHSLLGAAFVADWRAAARTPAFQAVQRAERDRVYWDPALAQAKADGLSPLGLYVYYDVLVNHGPGSDPESFGGIVAGVKARGRLAPAQGGDEVAFLTAVVDARDAVLRRWGDYQPDGRSTIARTLLASRNLALRTPLHWTVYGDAYSITTPPSVLG